MIKKRRLVAFSGLFFMCFVCFTLYFMYSLSEPQQYQIAKIHTEIVEQKIRELLKHLPTKYKLRYGKDDKLSDQFVNYLNSTEKYENIADLWKEVNSWVSKTQLYSLVPKLSSALHTMKTGRVIKADLDSRGSQLKFLFTLDGDQKVVFKPKRYEKEEIIEGVVYSGKDRYGSEILGFYLSGILNRPVVPLSVERIFDLKREILPLATEDLIKTTFTQNNKTCIFGLCHYCTKSDPACSDQNNLLTGALIFNVEAKFKLFKNPWRRTYKRNKPAPWELDPHYCKAVRKTMPEQRILDLIDVTIFDFLIQNGDRHHYEVLDGMVLWLDNGKGLGNPNIDHVDILAPLYQCCMLRKKTWQRLQELSGGLLKQKLEQMPDIKNIVTEKHLAAIERRLLILFATTEYCNSENGRLNLIK